MEKSQSTAYLSFRIAASFLGVNVPREFESRFVKKEAIEYELIRSAKELGLKVSAGKINLKKIDKTTVPVIVKLKDESYILITNRQNGKWFILNPLVGTPEVVEDSILFEQMSGRVMILGKKRTSVEVEVKNLDSAGLYQRS